MSRALEPDRARRRLDEPHDAVADGRLAAARLADEPEHLARRDRERHAVDRVHDAPPPRLRADVEVLDEVLDLERRARSAHAAPFAPGMEARDQVVAAAPRAARGTSRARAARRRAGSAAANAQPAGSSRERRARGPGSRCRRPSGPRSPGRGIAPSRPIVYGCCGCAKSSCDRRLLGLAAGVHDERRGRRCRRRRRGCA